MRLIALTLARNESWCLPATLRATLRWADGVVVYDHASTDRTPAIVDEVRGEHPGRVRYIRDDEPTWLEMDQRQRTLETARGWGATHMAVVDADEVLTENLVPVIRGAVEGLNPGEVLLPPWLCLWRGLTHFRDGDDSVWSGCMVSLAFADRPDLCWRDRDGGYCFHHREPYGSTRRPVWGDRSVGGLLHLQHANWRRLLAKQLLYELTETIRWGGVRARYAATCDEAGAAFRELPAAWRPPELAMVDLTAEPWQVAECRRLIREHGRERFSGCDLLERVEREVLAAP